MCGQVVSLRKTILEPLNERRSCIIFTNDKVNVCVSDSGPKLVERTFEKVHNHTNLDTFKETSVLHWQLNDSHPHAMAPNQTYLINEANGEPVSRTYQYRKVMKPMLERKRRARINHCLDQLKEIMTNTLQTVNIDDLRITYTKSCDLSIVDADRQLNVHPPLNHSLTHTRRPNSNSFC